MNQKQIKESKLESLTLLLGLTRHAGKALDNDDLHTVGYDLALMERGIELIIKEVKN